MANKSLFSSIKSLLPPAGSYNEAGGRAYEFTPKHALAQMAATGCFNGVYYASAQNQLDEMRALIDQVDDNVFLAKLAVYARERAYMKDMPAALLVMLSKRDAFQRWLNEASTGKLLSASIGNDPSLRDVPRMARPTPQDNERRALFGWLTGKETAKWPPVQFEAGRD